MLIDTCIEDCEFGQGAVSLRFDDTVLTNQLERKGSTSTFLYGFSFEYHNSRPLPRNVAIVQKPRLEFAWPKSGREATICQETNIYLEANICSPDIVCPSPKRLTFADNASIGCLRESGIRRFAALNLFMRPIHVINSPVRSAYPPFVHSVSQNPSHLPIPPLRLRYSST